MCEFTEPSSKQRAEDENKDKMYVLTDAIGRKHYFIAGENGMTEEWIARLRHDENKIHSDDYHFYYRWNGKQYNRRVLSIDAIPADELNRSPFITASKDLLTTLIEEQEQATFERKFKAAMDSLTDRQWRLVYKMFDLGMSDTEIAEEEGVSKMAINKRWNRIQDKINKIFSE